MYLWIAVSGYVLVAIVKKRINQDVSLYTLLQIFLVTFFEKMRLRKHLLAGSIKPNRPTTPTNQIDSRFNRTLLIRNSVRPQIVCLIPAHWVELQLAEYFWQGFA